eukprot:4172455-Pleurochrysis_carterae.AAC.1
MTPVPRVSLQLISGEYILDSLRFGQARRSSRARARGSPRLVCVSFPRIPQTALRLRAAPHGLGASTGD